MIDLVVVGGGPVGLATAIHARLAGLTVTVVEQRDDPIDKACGEGLMPDALAHVQRLGVDPPGRPLGGIRYVDGRRHAEARFSVGPGRGVRRTVLQGAMSERARTLGATFHHERAAGVTLAVSGVEVAGVAARYAIAADGLHSPMRSALGLQSRSRGRQRFGVRQHFRVAPWTDLVEVHWLPHAEVYVTPVADDTVGVAVLGGRPLSLAQAIAALPELAGRLGDTEAASSERGAGPLRQSTSARTAGRVLLVGDAAGYVDALTGEGLRIGFDEAEAAVQAIVRDDPASYEHEWARITRSYRYLTTGLLLAAGVTPTRRLIVPAASVLPGAFRRIVDSLAG